jgi:hypothetical protein
MNTIYVIQASDFHKSISWNKPQSLETFPSRGSLPNASGGTLSKNLLLMTQVDISFRLSSPSRAVFSSSILKWLTNPAVFQVDIATR